MFNDTERINVDLGTGNTNATHGNGIISLDLYVLQIQVILNSTFDIFLRKSNANTRTYVRSTIAVVDVHFDS